MPSLVTLLLSVSEVLAKTHGGGGGQNDPHTRVKVKKSIYESLKGNNF